MVAVLVSVESFIARHAPCLLLLVRARRCKLLSLLSGLDSAVNVDDETYPERETARSVPRAIP